MNYHVSDDYTVPFGTARANFYPGTGIPDYWYDGSINSDPRDGNFEAILISRIGTPTDVTLDIGVTYVSSDTYQIPADVCIEAGGTGKTMRIYMAQLLDNYPPDETYYRNTLMQGLAVSDVTLAPGECTQVSHTFTFNATSMAHEDDIMVIAWAQNVATVGPADVHQAAQLRWPVLAPDFSHLPAVPAVSETIQFTDETQTNGPAVDSWSWDFGDGGTSTAQNPTHAFSTAGCHDVTLAVTSGSLNGQITKGVPVDLIPPTAGFIASTNMPDVGQSVNFTDQSTGDITTRLWDFGDGNTSTQQNPTHTYTAKGEYTVTLSVANDCDEDETTMLITVCETVAPVADFIISPNPADVGQNIFFLDRSVGDVLTWDWDFGDGGTASTKNVVHAYSSPGAYDVSLTVSSGCLEDMFIDTVNVCTDPTADFSSWPPWPAVGEAVQFTDESTGGAVAWQWDFGDGQTSTAQNPSHAYNAGGNYTVTLTVTETYGCTAVTTDTVSVGVSADIFADGFESSDTSAWSHVVSPG